jgi:hypothetical protein
MVRTEPIHSPRRKTMDDLFEPDDAIVTTGLRGM